MLALPRPATRPDVLAEIRDRHELLCHQHRGPVTRLIGPIVAALPAEVTDPICRVVDPFAIGRRRGHADRVAQTLGCTVREARPIAAAIRTNARRANVDFARWWPSREQPGTIVATQGEEHLLAAAGRGRGVILASVHTVAIHFFNWLRWSPDSVANRRGWRVHALVDRGYHLRAQVPAGRWHTTEPNGTRAPREVLDALGAGDLVIMMVDVGGDEEFPHSVAHRLLGKTRYVRRGAASIARLAQAPIVPTLSLRTGTSRYALHFFPELVPPSPGDRAADPIVMGELLDRLATRVREYPDQYPT